MRRIFRACLVICFYFSKNFRNKTVVCAMASPKDQCNRTRVGAQSDITAQGDESQRKCLTEGMRKVA